MEPHSYSNVHVQLSKILVILISTVPTTTSLKKKKKKYVETQWKKTWGGCGTITSLTWKAFHHNKKIPLRLGLNITLAASL